MKSTGCTMSSFAEELKDDLSTKSGVKHYVESQHDKGWVSLLLILLGVILLFIGGEYGAIIGPIIAIAGPIIAIRSHDENIIDAVEDADLEDDEDVKGLYELAKIEHKTIGPAMLLGAYHGLKKGLNKSKK